MKQIEDNLSKRNVFEHFGVPVIPGAGALNARNCDILWKTVHECYDIITVIPGSTGQVTVKYREHFSDVHPGSSMVFEPGNTHYSPRGTAPGTFRLLSIPIEAFSKFSKAYRLGPIPHFNPQVLTHPHLIASLLTFHNLIESGAFFEELEQQWLLACSLLFDCGGEKTISRKEHDCSNALSIAFNFIHDHACDSVSLQHLAEVCDISPFYLCRAFKKRYGQTPHEFLLNVRLEKARIYLLKGQTVPDLGFADQSHFIRLFRRKWGVTPGKFQHIVHRTLADIVPS